MPTWVWVLLLSILIAAAFVVILWYVGFLIRPGTSPDSSGEASGGPDADPDLAPDATRAPRPRSANAKPPPALAGAVTMSGAASSGRPRASTSQRPPPAVAGEASSRAAPAPEAPPRKGKPPPAQAAWSTPTGKADKRGA